MNPSSDVPEFAAISRTPFPGVSCLQARYLRHAFERHTHDTFCIGVTCDGVQAFRCRGANRASTAGHIVALNPDEPHDGRSGTDGGYGYKMLYLHETVIREWQTGASDRPSRLGYFHDPVIRAPAAAAALRRAIAALDQPAETLRGQSLVTKAICALFETWASPRATSRRVATAGWIRRAREYLEERYAEDVTVESLTEVCGVSRVHVTRVFERTFGIPPHLYLNAVRLRHAKRLMLAGVPLAVVGSEVGYADQSHFTKRFKGAVGVGPAAWRRAVGCTSPG